MATRLESGEIIEASKVISGLIFISERPFNQVAQHLLLECCIAIDKVPELVRVKFVFLV